MNKPSQKPLSKRKISFMFFLNTKLRSQLCFDKGLDQPEERFPIYLNIRFDRTNTSVPVGQFFPNPKTYSMSANDFEAFEKEIESNGELNLLKERVDFCLRNEVELFPDEFRKLRFGRFTKRLPAYISYLNNGGKITAPVDLLKVYKHKLLSA